MSNEAKPNREKKARIGLLVVLTLILVGGLATQFDFDRSKTADAPADRITFQLPWTHTGSFAGYYVADQKGYYANEGIDLSFRTGGFDVDPVEAVASGKAQIGAANANLLIKARAQGLPVRALAAIHQRNPVVFITLNDSGISRPRQFAGKTIHVSRQNRPILEAIDDPVSAAGLTVHYDPEASLELESAFFSAMVPLINPRGYADRHDGPRGLGRHDAQPGASWAPHDSNRSVGGLQQTLFG